MNLTPHCSTPWRIVYWLVPMALLIASGCGKKEEASVTAEVVATPNQQVAAPNATQPTANRTQQQQPSATPAAEPAAPDLTQLSREVRRWILRNQKRPTTFEQVFGSSNIQVPPPPAGKKYAISREMKVVLVDR